MTELDQIALGKTGLVVSRLCLGTSAFGGDLGPFDRSDALNVVRRARNGGVTFFDTARAYGFGLAEEVLADGLGYADGRCRREDVVLATKGGLSWADGTLTRDASPGALRRDLETSLRTLRTQYVDLFQVHWPDPSVPLAESAGAAAEFVREGKVRSVGVSNFTTAQTIAFGAVDATQLPYHLLRRSIEIGELPFCARRHIGVIAYGALAHGLLSGRMTPDTVFASTDWRATNAMFRGEAFAKNLAMVRRLQQTGARAGRSVAQLALGWTLARPHVDAVTVGARSLAQLDDLLIEAARSPSPDLWPIVGAIAADGVPVGGPSPERGVTST